MSSRTKLLLVDDGEIIRDLFPKAIIDKSLLIETASDGKKALERLKNFSADVVLADLRMPDMDGLAFIEELRLRYPEIFVVVVAARGSIENAVKAMKAGAYDYILKPFDLDMIKLLIEKIAGHKRMLNKSIPPDKERRKNYRFENIIGQDPKMFEIFRRVVDVAHTSATVLITGESGTGKELIAEAIHYRSPRSNGPLVKVNCAALTETLINSELFGHEKGSFTGAMTQKKGHFERAHGGTIFLDEIGDIPMSTQMSLLRVLDLGTFQRVGSTSTLKVDTRIVCATNKDIYGAVKEKLFREDLFYRINVVSIHMPPLRERRSDIPLLANYYLKKCCAETKRKIRLISGAAMEMLTRYEWPGNVRQLANFMENSVIFCRGNEIVPENLPQELKEPPQEKEFSLELYSRSLPLAESTLIRKVLEETNWNLKQAAAQMDIARGTLYSKMKRYSIERPE